MMKKFLILLFLVGSVNFAIASRIDTLQIESSCMRKSVSNLIILPEGYNTSKERFPVVYLLHGAMDNFSAWWRKVPALKQYADTYHFIVVCPDGGYTSWYFDSPIDSTMRYETYVTQELVTIIDQTYKTRNNRNGRAISGLSMGGHGAFYLAFRHQDIWGAAGSTSGGLDLRPFPNNWDIAKRLGTYAGNKENWEKNSVINLVYLLNGNNLKLIFDCGNEDFFHDANKRMHEKLLQRNIPHDYIERPGKHNDEYWANSIKYQLLFFSDFFNQKN